MSVRYAISWLYGEFRMARFQRGRVVEDYTAPELIETQADFVQALNEARQHVNCKGRGAVAVLHEHDLHSHEFFEVPSMSRRDLERYLGRQVQQSTAFKEEAAWCYHETTHADGQEGVLLHMLPRRIVRTTLDACAAVGLASKRYVPLTEVVSAYLPSLNIEGTIIIAAVFRTRVEIVVADGGGEALFVRELAYGYEDGPIGRLPMDINRTIRYAKQQTGRHVDQVRMIGNQETQALLDMARDVDVEVHVDPATNTDNFWLEQVASLSGRLHANFVSSLAQRRITPDALRRMGVFATLSFVLASVLSAVVVDRLVATSKDLIVRVNAQNMILQEDIGELETLLANTREQADHLARLKANTFNLPTLFVLHLSRLAPPSVTFNAVEVSKVNEHWEVDISGVIETDLAATARHLGTFEEMLAEPPWHMTVTQSWKETWFDQLQSGALREGDPVGFKLGGVLR
ncbi:MAG: hypothetical protein NXH85_06815 [Pseudomonadaceae bacterium]|nr:hypothetical protein [Pseudomonadaceae bacterium]